MECNFGYFSVMECSEVGFISDMYQKDGERKLDPRPDLKSDTHRWELLLYIATRYQKYHTSGSSFEQILQAARISGLQIKAGEMGWVLKPLIGDAGFRDQLAYDAYRKEFLMGFATEIIDALRTLHILLPLEKDDERMD